MNQPIFKSVATLRDDQWEKLEPLLKNKGIDSRNPERSNRLFIDALLWYFSVGCTWADLPARFGKWNTIFIRLKRWNENGYWRQLVEDLRDDGELCVLLQKIEGHCEQRKVMAIRAAARKAARETYSISPVRDEQNA
jgi:transposase